VLAAGQLVAGGCGGVSESPDASGPTDASHGGGIDGTTGLANDSGATLLDAGSVSTPLCIPGISVACTGPGGCSSGQVCNTEGNGFGACNCAAPMDASTMACVPGQSIACAGAGGCISSQICSTGGTGYGACICPNDSGTTLSCIPGQSIACGGPYGCSSFQVCNTNGNGYEPCDCPDAGSYLNDAGKLPDGYAPLPPPVGAQGYNAIWAYQSNWSAPGIYLPLFSAPDCAVNPPYGDFYFAIFEPVTAGPEGTFPSCTGYASNSSGPCYAPGLQGEFGNPFEGGPGLSYTLSAFDANGIARGQMDTLQGIVPLVVKNCL
jgi:hypothetical protein